MPKQSFIKLKIEVKVPYESGDTASMRVALDYADAVRKAVETADTLANVAKPGATTIEFK